jgi:hypothetical protein
VANNEIRGKILPDGRLKVETDEIGQDRHVQADNIMKFLAEKLGAPVSEAKTKHAHSHTHAHDKAKAGH